MDINEAIAIERSMPVGSSYRIEFDMTEPARIIDIKDTLKLNGINANVKQWHSGGLWHLGISHRKPVSADGISALPVAIIPLIGFTLIIAMVGISIFRIKEITDSLMKLALIVGGFTVAVLYLKNKTPARR